MIKRHLGILFALLVFSYQPVLAQKADNVRYFDINWQETGPDKAYFIKNYFFAFDNKNEGKVITQTQEGRLISDIDYLDISKGQMHGVALYYDTLGQLRAREIYENGKKHGPLESYYPNGQKRRFDLYEQDELISGRCFSTTGEDTAYYIYLQMPAFPGGDSSLLRFMGKHTKYPSYARENSITGIVIVGFVVTSTGKIEEIEIKKSVDESLDTEALRVVNLMRRKIKWSPGISEGEVVSVQYNLPFRFSLR